MTRELSVETHDLSIHFGGLTAVDHVDLQVPAGSRRAIIGPNGAGKTTLFNLIAGQLRPDSGRVLVSGQDVTDLPVATRTRRGVARTFQISNLFDELSVAENVRIAVAGAHASVRRTFWRPLTGLTEVGRRVDELLEQWGLVSVRDDRAGELAYGQQRILEVVLATAGEPKVLLLDEPTAGVSKHEADRLVETLELLPRELTVIVVEHDMEVAFRLADEVTVMVEGRELITGSPQVVRADERVIDAYLGREG